MAWDPFQDPSPLPSGPGLPSLPRKAFQRDQRSWRLQAGQQPWSPALAYFRALWAAVLPGGLGASELQWWHFRHLPVNLCRVPFLLPLKVTDAKPGLELPCGFVATPPSLFRLGTSKLRQGYGRLQLRQGQAKSGILGVPSLPSLPGQATSTSFLLYLSPCPPPRPSPGP